MTALPLGGSREEKWNMEMRSVISQKNSLYINIPSSITEALEIMKGDNCELLLLPGYGILVRKAGSEGRFPAPLEAVASLQYEADNIVRETRRKMRSMVNQASVVLWEKVLSDCFATGLVKSSPPGEINEERGRLLLEIIGKEEL